MRLELLFRENGELSDFLDKRNKDLKREIEGYKEDYLLKANEGELIDYLISKYSIVSIAVDENAIYVVDKKEVDIDVSNDPSRFVMDRDSPTYVKGTQITIAVPFSGNPNLFKFRPSQFSLNPPRGIINEGEIHLIYERVKPDSEEVKRFYKKDVGELKRYANWIKKDVDGFNSSLKAFCKDIVQKRKKKFTHDKDVLESLGIPIKRRTDAPETYTVPEIKRKTIISRLKAVEKDIKPEPTLSEEEYENILSIIQNMVLVIERSPKAFTNMKEEDLRQHFLVQLNGQYEGMATGETFNYGGKTDILIRYEGENVFIAECKFWRGEKELEKTIDQLLGYTSWRDTKTAIILFNKNKEFSSVLDKIDSVVTSHDCYMGKHNLKSDKLQDETVFSYIFHQPEDKNKELILSVLAFNIPS